MVKQPANYNELKSNLIALIRLYEGVFNIPEHESILRNKQERRRAAAKAKQLDTQNK